MESKLSLNGTWQGRCIDPEGIRELSFTGTVPGCVHTDLMGVAIDQDIFWRDNADKCQWIENMDWEYTRTFEVARIQGSEELVFEGLDVYCDIYLNGTLLGSCDDMFIPYRFPVASCLNTGSNTLTVYFHSPIRAITDQELLPGSFTRERLRTRRIQCTYGWDWVARFVTCGIWRDVYLRTTEGLTTENLYVYTEHLSRGSAQIAFEAEFSGYEPGSLVNVQIRDPRGETVYSHDFYVNEPELKAFVDIPDAQLWYPHGYGSQPLYTLTVGDKTTSFGIRTVRIVQERDLAGSPYYLKCQQIKQTPSGLDYDHNEEFSGFLLTVNDTPIMCKGANWVPCEPFPSAESDEKITRILALSKAGGVNMIRVWGGGIFEKDHFYAECDRLGITVTQDFLMACGTYPEQEPHFQENLKKEAMQAALDLRNHPCLMWWSGDNENAVRGADHMESYKGRTVTHKSMLPVLNKLDPKRRFLLSSPYGGNSFASKTVGTTHNTQYLKYFFLFIEDPQQPDYKEYLNTLTARFIAEEPAMGAGFLSSMLSIMTEEDLYHRDEMWFYHTKTNPNLRRELLDFLLLFTQKVLGDFRDGYDRYFKLKFIHCEWIRVTFETARRNKGFCNGLIYWMLNDCWPTAASWSMIDYSTMPRPGYYAFKRCAQPVVASITDEQDGLALYISNDGLTPCRLNARMTLLKGNGCRILWEDQVSVGADIAQKIKQFPALKDDELLVCDIWGDGHQDRTFYKNGALLIHPTQAVTVVEQTDNKITLTAKEYVHAVELDGSYIFSDNYFSLLPGETRTIELQPVGEDSALTITGYTV